MSVVYTGSGTTIVRSNNKNSWKNSPRLVKFRNSCRYFWQTIRRRCRFSACLPVRQTIIIRPPAFSEEDEDELFGKTIAVMLRNMPPTERNLLKIQIFSCLVDAQNLFCRDEYLV